MALPDLITTAYALAALAEQGLSTAQLAHLAAAITAASRAIRRWCGDRDFTRTSYDRVMDVAHDGTVALPQFPVNQVTRVSGGRETALTIACDGTSNQRATVRFSTTGDLDDEAVTGLVLSRSSSGTATTSTILYSSLSPATITQLAAAVDALGGGWTAEVAGDLGAWPASELIGGEAALPALAGAGLELWAEDVPVLDLDRRTGILAVGRQAGRGDAFGPRWGPDWGSWDDGGRVDPGQVRVAWDAGWTTIPEPVQQACAVAVGALLSDLAHDQRLSSENAGAYSYVLNTAFADGGLPKAAQGLLAPYRIWHA